ncbi:MAG: hypothetical protein L0229_03910, partial [Blastocatellia bacterium]|nr:hypothetical protein [Blastocatellia bacterium]
MSDERDWVVLKPELNGFSRQFVSFCKRVEIENQELDEQLRNQALSSLRHEVSLQSANAPLSDDWIKLQLAKNVILDLACQSWQLKIEGRSVHVHSPVL